MPTSGAKAQQIHQVSGSRVCINNESRVAVILHTDLKVCRALMGSLDTCYDARMNMYNWIDTIYEEHASDARYGHIYMDGKGVLGEYVKCYCQACMSSAHL